MNQPRTIYREEAAVSPLPRLLLHACCAPCSTAVVERLQREFAVTLLFYNPNIHPFSEYEIRRVEIERWAQRQADLPLLVADYDPQRWDLRMVGRENDPEKGQRCTLCYEMRLEETARRAHDGGFEWFATVLSISPHKDAVRINNLGSALAERYAVDFYAANFKKQGGFQRSLEISHQQGFYRQQYCGCRYSLAQTTQRRQQRNASAADPA